MTSTPPAHDPGTYAAALLQSHEQHLDRPAFRSSEGKTLSHRDVLVRCARLVDGMAARGVHPGDRVVIALDNSTEALLLERAVMLWGLVRVAVSARLHPEEISWIARDCSAALVAVETRHTAGLDPDLRSRVVVRRSGPGDNWLELEAAGRSSSWVGARRADPAALMYTSGTTGRPKGAVTTQTAWLSMATAVGDLLGARTEDTLAHVAPFSHFSGSIASGYAIQGACITAVGRTTAARLPDQLRTIGATCVPMVPTMLGDLAAAHPSGNLDLPELKAVPYGGSTISPTVLVRARGLLGGVLSQFYGTSEALIPVLHLTAAEHEALDPDLPVPAGRPGPGLEVSLGPVIHDITQPEGQPLPVAPIHDQGELVVRGDRVMSGYWGQSGATKDVLTDGWYRTGDIAERGSSGHFTIVGRARDVIITGGFNVYPGEVERVITAIPGVVEVSVVKVRHPRWGEGVAAMIVTDGTELSSEEVVSACRAHLADYKKPVVVAFVDRLPRLSTGKVDSRQVEKLVAERPSA
jgi:acyl-CoA synthetase (AMP-forming)/AMP-acid ligase II